MAAKLVEEWRAVTIPKYHEDYEVSNLGDVRNAHTKRMLTKMVGICNYIDVSLTHNGETRINKVHRLVALAFIPNDDPQNKIEVNHKSGNKSDNSVTNLEWVTKKENCQHAKGVGLGTSIPVVKMSLDESQIIKVYGNINEASNDNRMTAVMLKNIIATSHIYQNYRWYYLSEVKDKFPNLFRKYRDTRRGENKMRVNTLNNSVNNKMILLMSLSGYPTYLFRNFSEIESIFELNYSLGSFESLPRLKNHYWIMYKDFLEEYEELDREKVNRFGYPKLKSLIVEYTKRTQNQTNLDYAAYQYMSDKDKNLLKSLNENLTYIVGIGLSIGAIAKMYANYKSGMSPSSTDPSITEAILNLMDRS